MECVCLYRFADVCSQVTLNAHAAKRLVIARQLVRLRTGRPIAIFVNQVLQKIVQGTLGLEYSVMIFVFVCDYIVLCFQSVMTQRIPRPDLVELVLQNPKYDFFQFLIVLLLYVKNLNMHMSLSLHGELYKVFFFPLWFCFGFFGQVNSLFVGPKRVYLRDLRKNNFSKGDEVQVCFLNLIFCISLCFFEAMFLVNFVFRHLWWK